MVGILIIAHGTFGEALIHCCTHVLGERPGQVGQLSVAVNDDPEAVLPRARAALEALDSGAGVLVVTDVLGATPSNIATRLLAPGRIEGVSGASLPMLIRALTYRDELLAVVVAKAISGGREGVVHIDGDGAGRS